MEEDADSYKNYEITEIKLKPDYEGENKSTLFKLSGENKTKKAVLYIHGFSDYFFQDHLASRYIHHNFDFYAIELRKYGRSLLPNQTPNFAFDLNEYYEELDKAIEIIKKEGYEFILINAHSTGCLTASLYLADRKHLGINALVLNSPFFDIKIPRGLKWVLAIGSFLGRFFPKMKTKGASDIYSRLYNESLHSAHRGEWNFNLNFKPLDGFPARLGWIRAIRKGQKRVHKGLKLDIPVLSMFSEKTSWSKKWNDDISFSDIILDVRDMEKYSKTLGKNVAICKIKGGVHDLTLSSSMVREEVFKNMFDWLDDILKEYNLNEASF